ncbi:F-box protein At4g00893-like [Solanum tuberosum]|uniref:F-box protein At4g00893-like n=1 Tax=Solanum tuberosum TaxID=4113 RepID=UPI00073A4286|nr:PREDICTED: F-box protein At4g00893-like [Solanum tuberosum]
MENALWSDCIPSDILGLISSRLVAAEYFIFRAVCKRWRYAPVTPPHCPAQPEKSPCLITFRGDTGIVEFFHPVYNVMTTTSIPIPKLMDSRIRSSKGNWLLISNGSRGMFFFNPISNDIIELPDLQEYENICPSWTFSCPPDSSSACFVVGFDYLGNPPDVYIIKVGETNWTYHNLNDPADRYKCISDHFPMQLKLQTNQHCVEVKFKFFNVWTEHDSFMGLVESIWKQDYEKDNMKKVLWGPQQLHYQL